MLLGLLVDVSEHGQPWYTRGIEREVAECPLPPWFTGQGWPRGLEPVEDTAGMAVPGFSAAMQLLWHFE